MRVRHVGDKRVQTVKTDAVALLDRKEWETEIFKIEPLGLSSSPCRSGIAL